MAKYLTTSGSKFEPYSYDELVKPLVRATEAHRQTQEVYDELAANAESVGALISKNDPRTQELFDSYSNTLDSYINDLQQNGYGLNAQRGLTQLRRMYGRNITSIQNAITSRREWAKDYAKRTETDHTLITDMNPAEQSLDNWIDNPEFGMYRSVSGATLFDQTSKIAAAWKDQLASEANTREWSPILNGMYAESASFYGATGEQLKKAQSIFLSGAPVTDTDPMVNALVGIMNSVFDSSGIASWKNEDATYRAKEYIAEGASSALGGEPKFTTLQIGSLSSGTKNPTDKPTAFEKTGNPTYSQVGAATYVGPKKREVNQIHDDIDFLEAVKEAGSIENYAGSTSGETEAKLTAMDDIKNYWSFYYTNKSAIDRLQEGRGNQNGSVAQQYNKYYSAYQEAISAFPDLKELNYTPVRGDIFNNNSERVANPDYYQIYDTLKQDPVSRYNKLVGEGGTADSALAGLHNQLDELVEINHLKSIDVTNGENISRHVNDYFANEDASYWRKYINQLVTSSGGKVDYDELNDMLWKPEKMANNKFAIDYYNGKVVLTNEGKRYYFPPDFFTPFAGVFDVATVNYMVQLANEIDEGTKKRFENAIIELANENGSTKINAPEAIKFITEWYRSRGGKGSDLIAGIMADQLAFAIQSRAGGSMPSQSDAGAPILSNEN